MKIDPAILRDLADLRKEIGGECYLTAEIRFASYMVACGYNCRIWPLGVTQSVFVPVFRETFQDLSAFAPAARVWWDEQKTKINAEKIRKMALAVIEVTLDKGVCLPADLRARNFSDAEIKTLGTLACEEAQRLADSGPFKIADGITGNGAPVDDEEG